jgi:type II secretory ATPase GspE/PulE/Tfp pilus assembly ATPase PilB-like protein
MSKFERVTLADFKPLPENSDQYPLEYIENNSVIKLHETEGLIQIGVCDPQDEALLENLQLFHQKQVVFHHIDRSELTGYLGERLANLGQRVPAGQAAGDERLLLDKLANDAPIVNLVNSIIIEAIRRQASDIHLECFSREMLVRYRLDGALQTVHRLDRESFPAVASRIKIMANLNIMERRLPQDGRITVHLGEDTVDMRVSVVPIADGESFVLRLFNKKASPLTLDQLGLSEPDREMLTRIAGRPNGLLLITGPTGSGKTTTLNAILQHIRSDALKIITIEDPIEYLIDGVDQIQTNDRIGLSFDSILRRLLRQDPNVIMVGEIRDTPTAELAVRAALTGHLVLSTLHTRDSVSAVTRLRNMQIEPYLLAAVLLGAGAQRLVRRICPACRQQLRPSKSQREILGRLGLGSGSLYRGKGCKACQGTGFRGRVAVFEMFESCEELEAFIVQGRRDAEVREWLKSRGMRSLALDGFQKALDGVTTFAEAQRAVAG